MENLLLHLQQLLNAKLTLEVRVTTYRPRIGITKTRRKMGIRIPTI